MDTGRHNQIIYFLVSLKFPRPLVHEVEKNDFFILHSMNRGIRVLKNPPEDPTRRRISRGTHFWHLKCHSSTSSMRNLEEKIHKISKLSKFEKSLKSHTKSNDKFVQNKVENTFLLFVSDLFRVWIVSDAFRDCTLARSTLNFPQIRFWAFLMYQLAGEL